MEMEMGMGMGGGDGSVQRAACAGTGVGPVGLAPGQAKAAIPTLPYLKVPCTSTSYSTTSTYIPDLLGTVRVHVYYGSDSEEIC